LPDELKTRPGVLRNRAEEEEIFARDGPLPVLLKMHWEAATWYRRQRWLFYHFLYGTQKKARADAKLQTASIRKEGATPLSIDPTPLTKRVKEMATRLGLSAVGVTRFDPVLTMEPYLSDQALGDRVIVCALAQNWEAIQGIPSDRHERAHFDGDVRVQLLTIALAKYLTDLGYIASASRSNGMAVAYGVEAGLGQLGLNGQLLTPFAGSRTRLAMITTNAPLAFDSPVDYGIPAICDLCKSCVRNCPSGAIRSKREFHRGVYKAKIKLERCFPVVAQANGCSVCIKVCPIQRYGLPAVIDEYKRSGKILGKDSEELEGYFWPVDGRYYAAGERPAAASTRQFLNPPGFLLDLGRAHVVGDGPGENVMFSLAPKALPDIEIRESNAVSHSPSS
jgi:ferredoxin